MHRKAVESKVLPEGWREVGLTEICKVITSPIDKKTVDGELPVKLCNYTDVYYNNIIDSTINFMTATAKSQEKEKFSILKGDVIITKDSETPDDIGVPAYVKETVNNLLCGYHLAILRFNKEVMGKYIYYTLMSSRVKHDFYKFANGITRFGLTKESYQKIKIPIPPLQEQKAIASLLEKWDTAIEKTEALIAAKEQQFKWLLKTLISDQQDNPEWRRVMLGDILSYEQPTKYIVSSTDYTKKGSVTVLTANKSFVLGYTKEKDGIFNEHPVIIFDDFTTANKYVNFQFKVKSSAMKILKPTNNNVNLKFIHHSMRFIEFPLGGHKRYWISEYQYLEIKLPSLIEQKRIIAILDVAQKEGDLLKQLTEQYRTQKRGLMQKLLTG